MINLVHISFAPPVQRLRLDDGRHVFVEWNEWLGLSVYRDRAAQRQIDDWWEDPAICHAIDWMAQRGGRA